GQKLRVAAAVGEMREAELSPRADGPVAVAVVDDVDRSAVREGVVRMEVGRAAQRFEGRRIAAVLRVESHAGERQVVVTGRGAGAVVLAPVAIRGLFFGGEAVEDTSAEPL